MTPTVCIITHCPDLTYLYGTLLTVQTVRIGFPTARVIVCDNASLPESQRQIRQAADTAGAQFLQLASMFSPPQPHWDVLCGLVLTARLPFIHPPIRQGPLVILDGDILFWENCESWQFDGLLAGRLIPAGVRGMGEETVICLPRLHTSFLWIPDRRTLRQRIEDIQTTHPSWDPFTPRTIPNPFLSRVWYLGDTASNLYGAVREQCAPFTPSHLDCYDHLFCGSSPANIAQLGEHPFPGYEWFPRVHAAAQRGELSSIRGVWREQEAYFTGAGKQEQG